MSGLVFINDALDRLLDKLRSSGHYLDGKLVINEWEIREALDTVPIIDLKVMIRPQMDTVPTDPREMASKFTSCCDCVHAADSTEICMLRECVHAIGVPKDCFRKRPDVRRPDDATD